jgi:hypothetical protein
VHPVANRVGTTLAQKATQGDLTGRLPVPAGRTGHLQHSGGFLAPDSRRDYRGDRGALRTPKPFVRRNRRRHTATLVTEKTGLRRRFVDALQEDSEVLGFSSAGTGLWVVRAPIHAADRALSDLGWEA